jgi:hypothetical protein
VHNIYTESGGDSPMKPKMQNFSIVGVPVYLSPDKNERII